jgi:DMSO/TMAO reductase YedYZ heme-binding membrane subunit
VLHYIWKVKPDATNPIRYAVLLAVLLGIRAGLKWRTAGNSGERPALRNSLFDIDNFL